MLLVPLAHVEVFDEAEVKLDDVLGQRADVLRLLRTGCLADGVLPHIVNQFATNGAVLVHCIDAPRYLALSAGAVPLTCPVIVRRKSMQHLVQAVEYLQ